MRRLSVFFFAPLIMAIAPLSANACGLADQWRYTQENEVYGFLLVTETTNGQQCSAVLTTFTNTGESVQQACEILRGDGEFTIQCTIVAVTAGTWSPDSFRLRQIGRELIGVSLQEGIPAHFWQDNF